MQSRSGPLAECVRELKGLDHGRQRDTLSGIGISKSVIAQIVSTAVEKVEGVARVGGNDIASGLVSFYS